ncbi:MAG: glutamine-hydrolyzing carbamoyl-phosphate synthase small subunit [Calditrichia bacterium]
MLEDGTVYEGFSFGYPAATAGEVVFNTGMVGYPETFSDPSYFGQILVLTYPLIGNYGMPAKKKESNLAKGLESERLQIKGIIVSDISCEYSHWNAGKSLAETLMTQKIPALRGIDTRALTKKLREKGTLLGKIVFYGKETDFFDPDRENLVRYVSVARPIRYGTGDIRLALLDCGCKHNIIRSLLQRGVEVLRLPWDHDLSREKFHALLISNGPGNPKMYRQTILQIHQAMNRNIPMLGICLGHQLMALATGANTYKLKYGHRSQNQPVIEENSRRCLITSQNHGFAVDQRTLPAEWLPWFTNLNDGTNEGIRHVSDRFMGVQFHPEAMPGPMDAGYIFDEFLKIARK